MQSKILFGTLLRDERKRRGLTQEELAELTDKACTGSYISYLERHFVAGGKVLPKPDVAVIDALATALRLPLKVARDASGLSLPEDESGEGAISSIFSMLFVGYERLDSTYRQMAITLCGGILNNLYEIQLSGAAADPRYEGQQNSKADRQVPIVYAATEVEVEKRRTAEKAGR